MLLCDERCDINVLNERTVIMPRAVKTGKRVDDKYATIVRILLNNSCLDTNAHNRVHDTALHVAVNEMQEAHSCDYSENCLIKHPCVSIAGALMLLRHERCDVNVQDEDGNTALMLAVTLILEENDKFAQLTKHLLDHPQIDVNIRNDNEATALHVACGGIYVYLRPRSHIGAQLLLDDGRCDVNAEDKHSETPLMRVVQKIETRDGPASKIFILLLKQPQLDVNKKNRLGKGALHHAWKYDRPDNSALELLLKDERCDVNLQDGSGETLLIKIVSSTSGDEETSRDLQQ